ncbi:hypothetical protein JH26_00120 [Microvirga sp. BSC39]|nr:hypothetical protein JH26_00120 [Microvirga sp. BSC39]
MILTRIAPADASGVSLDRRQSSIKGCEGPMLDAGHGFQRMAFWVDCELLGRDFLDLTHRTAE